MERSNDLRTSYCGTLRRQHIGQTHQLCGWVQTRRDMGGVSFIDLHDREGTLQVVVDLKTCDEESFATSEYLKNQSVIQVEGKIELRDETTYNPSLPTGEIELRAEKLTLLSQADSLPFSPSDSHPVREDLRLTYRYLDLRRERMQENLRFRHMLLSQTQRILDDAGFISV